jgi:hypothetical protein
VEYEKNSKNRHKNGSKFKIYIILVDLILLQGSVIQSMTKNRINLSQQIGYKHIKCEGLNYTGYIDEIKYYKKYHIFYLQEKMWNGEQHIKHSERTAKSHIP